MKSKNSASETLATLQKYFKQVDQLSDAFEHYLWSLVKKTIPLLKKGNLGAIFMVIKVIELEEKLDEMAA
jgi:hypothetical protein